MIQLINELKLVLKVIPKSNVPKTAKDSLPQRPKITKRNTPTPCALLSSARVQSGSGPSQASCTLIWLSLPY